MIGTIDTKKNIWNQSASISIDLFGGAITDFHLRKYRLNTLSFCFLPEQMPENNRPGAVYQGHFLCLGRWGSPSPGEIKAGIPNHGQFANIMWKETTKEHLHVNMKVCAARENLSVERTVELDRLAPVFRVDECVVNTGSLGRMYNMVQHPTVAAPFLDIDVLVDCNATTGFDYLFDEFSGQYFGEWPHVLCTNEKTIDVSSPTEPYSSVFSFIVDPCKEFGWITAYSPSHELLLGYLWKREDYPWINHWIHWQDETLLYRGLEFGTTGLHKPFNEILDRQLLEVMGERTYRYLDAGESCSRRYLSFLHKTGTFNGVSDVQYDGESLRILEKNSENAFSIPLSLTF